MIRRTRQSTHSQGAVRRHPSSLKGLAGVAAVGLSMLVVAGCSSSVAMPEDFPSGDVPLYSQKLTDASGEGSTWNLTLKGGGEEMDAALQKLEDAGFTVIGESLSDVGSTYSLTSGTYNVRLGLTADGKDLTYGVATSAASATDEATDAPADETNAPEESDE